MAQQLLWLVVLGNQEGSLRRGDGECRPLVGYWGETGTVEIPELLNLHSSQKADGHWSSCFVVQIVSMRAVVLTGYQRQRDVAPLLEDWPPPESEWRKAAGIHILAKGGAYQHGLLGFGGSCPMRSQWQTPSRLCRVYFTIRCKHFESFWGFFVFFAGCQAFLCNDNTWCPNSDVTPRLMRERGCNINQM